MEAIFLLSAYKYKILLNRESMWRLKLLFTRRHEYRSNGEHSRNIVFLKNYSVSRLIVQIHIVFVARLHIRNIDDSYWKHKPYLWIRLVIFITEKMRTIRFFISINLHKMPAELMRREKLNAPIKDNFHLKEQGLKLIRTDQISSVNRQGSEHDDVDFFFFRDRIDVSPPIRRCNRWTLLSKNSFNDGICKNKLPFSNCKSPLRKAFMIAKLLQNLVLVKTDKGVFIF